jgi:hypothetical protein
VGGGLVLPVPAPGTMPGRGLEQKAGEGKTERTTGFGGVRIGPELLATEPHILADAHLCPHSSGGGGQGRYTDKYLVNASLRGPVAVSRGGMYRRRWEGRQLGGRQGGD